MNEKNEKQDVEDIIPEWVVNSRGLPHCIRYSNDPSQITKGVSFIQFFRSKETIECTTCQYSHNEACYFSTSKITDLEKKWEQKKIRCELCGQRINWSNSFLMSYYYKEKFNLNMNLPCCSCYNALVEKKYLEYSRSILKFYIKYAIIFLILFILMHLLWIPAKKTYSLSFYIIEGFGISFFTLFYYFFFFKRIVGLIKGRKQYQIKYNQIFEEIPALSRREKFLDSDDKTSPPKGAYYSPGYNFL